MGKAPGTPGAGSPGSSRTAPSPSSDPNALGLAFKERLRSNDILIGGMVMEYIRPSLVKMFKQAGYDFIMADGEHVLFSGRPAMADFVLTARDNGIPVICKIPELGRPEVARLLEAGAFGMQLPRTESRAQVDELADYMKFPPVGSRAGAPIFGNVDYVWPADDRKWIEDANRATIIVGHIETRLGMENIDDIITAPHLDMIYIGAYDFSISMGHPGEYDHPEVAAGMKRVLEACLRASIPFGTTPSGPPAGGRLLAQGARFFLLGDELSMLNRAAAAQVDSFRIAIQTVETVRQYLGKS